MGALKEFFAAKRIQTSFKHSKTHSKEIFHKKNDLLVISELFNNLPLLSLCIANTYINWKGSGKALENGIVWIGKYLQNRITVNAVEAYYNTAQFSHSYGLRRLALMYYRRSL